jgi:diguanylate cyclase (GGDEF)-like protein
MKHRRAAFYTGTGMALATGAPLGWLVRRASIGALAGGTFLTELQAHAELYGYLFGGTAVVLGIAGAIAGALADKLVDANARLRMQATTDELTGLKNARYFHEWLSVECARADRAGRPLTLIMGDLDHFKRLNDRRGHAVGDKALAHAARLLAAGVRAGDIACRVGGEEFAIICPDCEPTEAMRVAERIRAALESTPLLTDTTSEAVTASFGVAAYVPATGPGFFFQAADAALYAAKGAGRNRVALASSPKPSPPGALPSEPAPRPV